MNTTTPIYTHEQHMAMQEQIRQKQEDHQRLIKETSGATGAIRGGSDPWANRSSGMKCSSCIWFVPKVVEGLVAMKQDAKIVGRCRRHAPTMNGYPVVFQTDWCGDHRLDENKA